MNINRKERINLSYYFLFCILFGTKN